MKVNKKYISNCFILILSLFSDQIIFAFSFSDLNPKNAIDTATGAIEKAGEAVKDFSKDAWNKTQNEVSGKFKDMGDIAGSAINTVKDIGEKAWNDLKNLGSCLDVVRYGTEYAAEKAAYESAKSALESSKKAIGAISVGADFLGKLSADALKKGVNIQEFSFDSKPLSDLTKLNGPTFKIKGAIFGKDFSIEKQINFRDFKNAGEAIASIAKDITNDILKVVT